MCVKKATEKKKLYDNICTLRKKKGFDWGRPQLLRFHVHRRSDEAFQFTLSFHHSILDGWSVATMLTELFQRYFALLGQRAGAIEPPPEVSFRDFVAAEREAVASQEAKCYWAEKLSDIRITKLPRSAAAHQDASPDLLRRGASGGSALCRPGD